MSGAQEFEAHDFPLLREFARGYLHQDMLPEYGSPINAAKAYVEDVSSSERKQVAAEALSLRKRIADFPIGEINVVFAKLGAAWMFKSKEEISSVLKTLEQEI